MHFGEIIKRKRLIKGYTLTDIERMTGIKKAALSDMENARRGDNPTFKTMRSIAESLDLVFIIGAGKEEPLKAMDARTDIELQGTQLDNELQTFIKEPTNEMWLRLAYVISKDPEGLKSYAVKAIYDSIKK